MKAISDRHYEMMHPKRALTSSDKQSQPSPSRTHHYPSLVQTATPSHVYIQSLPASAAWHMQNFGGCPSTMSDIYSPHPHPLRMIDSTVTFTSMSQAPCQAIFTVFRGGQIVHQEVAMVSIRSAATAPGAAPSWLYTTSLAPTFWQHLCDSEGAFVLRDFRVPRADVKKQSRRRT